MFVPSLTVATIGLFLLVSTPSAEMRVVGGQIPQHQVNYSTRTAESYARIRREDVPRFPGEDRAYLSNTHGSQTIAFTVRTSSYFRGKESISMRVVTLAPGAEIYLGSHRVGTDNGISYRVVGGEFR